MTYANLLSREETEQRIRELHASGYKVRDLASLFGLHPEIIKRVIEGKERGAGSISEGSSTQGTAREPSHHQTKDSKCV